MYQQPKNEKDFNEYYQIAISVTKYYDRLIDKLAKELDLNRSQVVRKAIYELYKNNVTEFRENKEIRENLMQ